MSGKLVVFDIDGTLLDTREYIIQGFEHTLRTHGLPPRPRAEIASHIGKRLDECYDCLAPGAPFTRLKAVHDAFQEENLALVCQFEAATETLATLREAGHKLALWTGRAHGVRETLDVAAVDTGLFELIVDPLAVPEGKPHPAGLQHIMTAVGAAPHDVVMVGDAAVDIIAGKRAGVGLTVGLTHGFGTRDDLERAGADHIVGTLSHVARAVDGWHAGARQVW